MWFNVITHCRERTRNHQAVKILTDLCIVCVCLCVFASPVPEIRWTKRLEPMPTSADISMSGAVLRIFNIQFEDEGTYECEAENHRGKDKHSAMVYVEGW